MTGLALFASQIPWTWGVSLAKISISFLLLRIKHTIRWQIFLYTMIIILVANSISANIFQLGLCRPLASIWDPFIPVKHCWPIHYPRVCIIVNAVVNIVTDVLFTLIPLTFIYKIRRPLREKILLGFLLGLGIVASAASIVKVTLADEFPGSTDQTYDSVELSMWSIIEGNTTIIAACAPCLKSPAERALRRLGLLSLHEASGGGSPEHPPDGEGARLRVDSAVAFYHEEMERILSPAQASTPPQV